MDSVDIAVRLSITLSWPLRFAGHDLWPGFSPRAADLAVLLEVSWRLQLHACQMLRCMTSLGTCMHVTCFGFRVSGGGVPNATNIDATLHGFSCTCVLFFWMLWCSWGSSYMWSLSSWPGTWFLDRWTVLYRTWKFDTTSTCHAHKTESRKSIMAFRCFTGSAGFSFEGWSRMLPHIFSANDFGNFLCGKFNSTQFVEFLWSLVPLVPASSAERARLRSQEVLTGLLESGMSHVKATEDMTIPSSQLPSALAPAGLPAEDADVQSPVGAPSGQSFREPAYNPGPIEILDTPLRRLVCNVSVLTLSS